MPLELRVVWDGNVLGLADHRLSIGSFAEPMAKLLAALRRIASNIVGDALEDRPATVGRLAEVARQLDVEIVRVEGSSSGFAGLVSLNIPTGSNLPLFDTLPETATMELLTALELEGKGTPKDKPVRQYIRSLPLGLGRHSYSLHDNGRELKTVTLFGLSTVNGNLELPYFAEYIGSITGVGFEPGRPEVRIKTEEHQVTLFATALQVEGAWALRGSTVKALAVVQDPHSRLLRLQESQKAWRVETRERAIFSRWDSLCVEGSLEAAWNAELYTAAEDAVQGLCFAGCLLFYLLKNHCFIDGNKRIAWASCMEILRILGLTINLAMDQTILPRYYCG